MRIILEPAFVLHTKSYRDTSLIVDLFTLNHGKISVIARSARGHRSRFKGCLVPFAPLLVTAAGKTELLLLTDVEASEAALFLQGNKLFTGFYLNELLLRLLQKQDAFPSIFNAYQQTLKQLERSEDPQISLRTFELQLLADLGYGLQLNFAASGSQVESHLHYAYHFDQGLIQSNVTNNPRVFQGQHLLAIAKQNFETVEVVNAARRLLRIAISALLGDYQLKTRELFL